MARGDHIYVHSFAGGIPFQHHGIDMGDGSVIHLASANSRVAWRDTSGEFCVRRDSWDDFCLGRSVHLVQHEQARHSDEVAATAENLLGRCGYSLLEGNCEHFATLCATGKFHSQQIELSEATVAALCSLGTKAFWSISGKLGTQLAARTATRSIAKVHPASMLADGVEIVTLLAGCRIGLTAERSRRLAKIGGILTATGVGIVVGGPAGAAASAWAHTSAGAIGERLCQSVRKLIS